jgi:hypothetical protein
VVIKTIIDTLVGREPAPAYEAPYLLQRLERPKETYATVPALAALSFGCGTHGMTEDAVKMIAPHFSFAYMGDAMYERGDTAQALYVIAQNAKRFSSFKLHVAAKTIKNLPWSVEREIRRKRTQDARATVLDGYPGITVWGFYWREHIEKLESDIEMIVRGERESQASTGMNWIAFGDTEHKTIGWLDIRTAAMWFSEEDVFRGVAGLFGIDAEIAESA